MDSLGWISIGSILYFASLCLGQNPCSPMDPGPYKGTNPMLYFNVEEMSTEDLQSAVNDPTRVKIPKTRSQLRLYGDLSSGHITLKIDDFHFFNPMDYFEWVSDDGKTYLQLQTGIDRDGFTASSDDDLNVIPFTLTCIPGNNSAIVGTKYDAQIFITDVNDNTPTFLEVRDVIISEATPADTIITRMVAEDKDSNVGQNMTFSLLSEKDKFNIDSLNGDIRLTRSLDFENMNKSYNLVIVVQDGGPAPVRSVTATLHVTLTDADDQGPVFVYSECVLHRGRCSLPSFTTSLDVKKDTPLYFLPVPKNKHRGFVPLNARDLDTDIDSEIVFKITSTIPPGHVNEFQVETSKTTDGLYQASITGTEDREYSEGFQVFLMAEEQTINKHFAMALITFQNDNTESRANKGIETLIKYEESYTDLEVGLIAACAVLATGVFCLLVALGCSCLRHYGPDTKGKDIGMETQM